MQLKIKSKGLFVAAVLLLCTASQLFSYGGNTALAPLLKSIDGYAFYGLIAALGSAGMMISLPAVGALSAKIGNKSIMILGTILMLIGRIMMQFANTVFTVALWQVVGSIGNGMIITAPYVLFGTVFDRASVMKYYGFIATFNALGSLVGPIIAGSLVDAGLIRISFITWIPLFLLAMIVICVAFPNMKRPGNAFDITGWIYLAVIVFAFVIWTGISGSLVA